MNRIGGLFRAGQAAHSPVLSALSRLPAAPCRSGSKLAKLEPAAPGTVTEYDQHLFIEAAGQSPADWPATVEKTPALLHAFAALAKWREHITGTVKVTLYASPHATAAAPDKCNAILFPAGLRLIGLRVNEFEAMVRNHIVDRTPGLDAFAPHGAGIQELQGLHLFVCSHGSRDARCGRLGPPLARRLRTIAAERGFVDQLSVYECSHVGGHKYAGNVLVFGAISPNDGDWYGGVSADEAEEFLTALTEIECGSEGGFEHPVLRQWWRGRMGLTKEQQKSAFEHCTLCGSDDSDCSDADGS